MVYWTCNHCPYALAWHERLLDVARDYSDRGVRVLAISSNDPERYQGAPDADYDDPSQDAAWLRAALDAVLAGREPDPSETEAEGCTIKWKP